MNQNTLREVKVAHAVLNRRTSFYKRIFFLTYICVVYWMLFGSTEP